MSTKTATQFTKISDTEYRATNNKWLVSYGLGHPAGPDFGRIWTLYRLTGETVIEDGIEDEVLTYTLGHHPDAATAMAAADWTEDQRKERYHAAQRKVIKAIQKKYGKKGA